MTPPGRATAPTLKLSWLQFRLRTLFILVILISGPLSWIMVERGRIAQLRVALREMGGTHGHAGVYQPGWHQFIFGSDPRYYVDTFYVDNRQCGDESLSHLRDLKNLKFLSLDNTGVTDEGLLLLNDLPNLKYLHLRNTQITDAGMGNLKGCHADRLYISGTRVTRSGRLNYLEARPHSEVLPIP